MQYLFQHQTYNFFDSLLHVTYSSICQLCVIHSFKHNQLSCGNRWDILGHEVSDLRVKTISNVYFNLSVELKFSTRINSPNPRFWCQYHLFARCLVHENFPFFLTPILPPMSRLHTIARGTEDKESVLKMVNFHGQNISRARGRQFVKYNKSGLFCAAPLPCSILIRAASTEQRKKGKAILWPNLLIWSVLQWPFIKMPIRPKIRNWSWYAPAKQYFIFFFRPLVDTPFFVVSSWVFVFCQIWVKYT